MSTIFLNGIARELAEFRLNNRCVFNSGKINLGNVNLNVVIRSFLSFIESKTIFAFIVFFIFIYFSSKKQNPPTVAHDDPEDTHWAIIDFITYPSERYGVKSDEFFVIITFWYILVGSGIDIF